MTIKTISTYLGCVLKAPSTVSLLPSERIQCCCQSSRVRRLFSLTCKLNILKTLSFNCRQKNKVMSYNFSFCGYVWEQSSCWSLKENAIFIFTFVWFSFQTSFKIAFCLPAFIWGCQIHNPTSLNSPRVVVVIILAVTPASVAFQQTTVLSDIPTVPRWRCLKLITQKRLLLEHSVVLDVRLLLAEGMELRIKHRIGCWHAPLIAAAGSI